MTESSTDPPFAGIKVADFAWVGVGPIVVRHLADFGATVVRVETSTRPDTLRLAPPFREGVPGIDRSAFGAVYNTNKLGLALNLRLPRAREVALRLVAWADIVTDSMTPGSLAKLGLSYEDIRRVNPNVIMYSTTQQGQTGPYRSFGGYGQHGAATAGFHALTGWADRPPAGIFGAYTDFVAPWFLYTALVAALDHRDRTGEGQYLDQSQVEAALYLLGPQLLDYHATGHALTRAGDDDPQMYPHGAYACGAGGWGESGVGSRESGGQGRSAAGAAGDEGAGQGVDEGGAQTRPGVPGRAPHNTGDGTGNGNDRGDSETRRPDAWLALAVRDDADWAALARVLGRPEWAEDGMLRGAEARRARAGEIETAIAAWTAVRTPHEAAETLQAAGVPAGPVQTCADLFEDPQLLHRGHWWFLDHAVIGRHAYDAPAWKLSRTPAQGQRAGPTLGQHTFEVCRDILGLSDEEIAELSVAGVFE